MSAPIDKALLAPFQPTNLTYAAAPVQPGRASLAARAAAALRWVAEYPRRMAVMDELQRLSDRELADIGLTRATVRRVFSR